MKTIRRIATSVCAFAAMAVTVAAQESLSKGEEMMKKSLSERLIGIEAIKAVVNEFVARVAADDRVNKKFAKSNADRQ
jgi:hypothetical protein